MRSILKYWGVIVTLLVWITGGTVWLLKLGWRVDTLEKRVLVIETKTAELEKQALIRQGAAEVWRARGNRTPTPQ